MYCIEIMNIHERLHHLLEPPSQSAFVELLIFALHLSSLHEKIAMRTQLHDDVALPVQGVLLPCEAVNVYHVWVFATALGCDEFLVQVVYHNTYDLGRSHLVNENLLNSKHLAINMELY